MIAQLDTLRAHFGKFLLLILWAHVPALVLIALQTGHSPLWTALAGMVLAGCYHLSWLRHGAAPVTRYLSAVALMGEPAIMLFLLTGHTWQMDMHMYFFAMLALTIAWCDWRAIVTGAVAVSLHHLVLLYLLPSAVFSQDGNIGRVILHAGIVIFQTIVLVWISHKLVESFDRIGRMSEEILIKNEALTQRTREAEEANRAKSLFLASMSHEIRTPMNAILGFCHLIARTDLSPKQKDHVSKINDAGVSLLRLINDILDFSKNEAGKLTLEARPFDVRAAITNQINLVNIDADNKRVKLETRISPAVPRKIIGDELRFNQVVLNLLSNAVKFTENGTVIVRADVASSQDRDVVLELSVRDSGIGMDEQQQAKLFKSFSQADSSTTRQFGGTGLGLAICRQIVEQMGGNIRVESKIGEGSTFTFRIKVLVEDEHQQDSDRLPAQIQTLNVLAADDNPAARQIIHEIFASWDMAVDLVASGEEALSALDSANKKGTPYDLVLLDWKMPGMDGMDTARAMRSAGNQEKMPITLMVTAYCADEFMQEARAADISAFLQKPVDPRMLRDTILDLFSGQPPADTLTSANAPAQAARTSPRIAAAHEGLRILVVDDNEINREIAAELLRDAGLETDCAENGRIACGMMIENGDNYACVLMDVQMPEMDGIAATRAIRESWPAARLPIIAMTAHAYEEEKQRCFDAGMNDHIAKPVDPTELIEKLNRWLTARGKARARPQATADTPSMLPDELPPFDLAAALGRVNGKTPLLRKLIINFGEQYAAIASEIRNLIVEDQAQDARRLAHTLKGVAGSLEIRGLQASAASVEDYLSAGNVGAALSTLAEMEEQLTPAIAAARSLKTHPVNAALPASAETHDDASAAALEDLRTHLKRRSLGARSSFDRYATATGIAADARAFHPILKAVEKLDYDTALKLIENLQYAYNPRDESAA
ncbi:sensor histidine kinase/response regulator [Hyphomonas neptunium ATCC 15444]|uniref:histidine kinase n=2 Tax=Hyphomonas TaxID=85 RepID=Q0C222_HYPNA|nr:MULTISPECIES: hybrid sensor histidine kinase/response regulator [Hyphomonas]ABI78393.1 sensor histidine kinase/response regulator [Hyphomonas neptunium ATCC 15444]KCZ93064.1 sensor histidine kinase/response regulator [Hyphomonas hirschiana VP5]